MSSAGEKGKKRALDKEESSKGKIIIQILGPDGEIMNYRVQRDKPLQKLLMQYCEVKHLEYRAMDFICDGARVLVRRTPDELHMEDGDQIDAMVRAGGGGATNALKQAR